MSKHLMKWFLGRYFLEDQMLVGVFDLHPCWSIIVSHEKSHFDYFFSKSNLLLDKQIFLSWISLTSTAQSLQPECLDSPQKNSIERWATNPPLLFQTILRSLTFILETQIIGFNCGWCLWLIWWSCPLPPSEARFSLLIPFSDLDLP